MTARIFLTSWSLLTLVLLGCDSANSKSDIGPSYIAPSGTSLQKIDGVTYAYVATPERQKSISSGFAQLKIGQSREEIRTLLGAPDFAIAMHRPESTRFTGWHYIYNIRTIYNWTNSSDQWVEMMFDQTSDRLYWAHSNAIPGLTDVGALSP
jgi:hypothetical protein